jgi:hypothetical protein
MAMRASPDGDRLRLLTKGGQHVPRAGRTATRDRRTAQPLQARVSRPLKEASELGIIRTIAVLPPGLRADIEDQIIQRYGLQDVMVVDVEGTTRDITAALGTSGTTACSCWLY